MRYVEGSNIDYMFDPNYKCNTRYIQKEMVYLVIYRCVHACIAMTNVHTIKGMRRAKAFLGVGKQVDKV